MGKEGSMRDGRCCSRRDIERGSDTSDPENIYICLSFPASPRHGSPLLSTWPRKDGMFISRAELFTSVEGTSSSLDPRSKAACFRRDWMILFLYVWARIRYFEPKGGGPRIVLLTGSRQRECVRVPFSREMATCKRW